MRTFFRNISLSPAIGLLLIAPAAAQDICVSLTPAVPGPYSPGQEVTIIASLSSESGMSIPNVGFVQLDPINSTAIISDVQFLLGFGLIPNPNPSAPHLIIWITNIIPSALTIPGAPSAIPFVSFTATIPGGAGGPTLVDVLGPSGPGYTSGAYVVTDDFSIAWDNGDADPTHDITCGTATLTLAAQCDPQELAKLIASDAAAGDGFGYSVAVSGDTAVVGAAFDDHGGATDAGSAYVFVRTGAAWTQQAKLIASDTAAGDRFGYAVAVSGDTAVVGAYQDDHAGGTDAGSVYVFVRTGGAWTQQAKLIAFDAAAGDAFGYSVALSGDTAVIGAVFEDHAGVTSAGSAYVFVRSGAVWTQQAKLIASDTADGDYFGDSVALSGDTAAVGAPADDHAGASNAGSAYVFVRSGVAWIQQAKLIAADAAANDFFGAVALSGNTAVVGAQFDDHSGGLFDAGSAYVFVRTGGVWTQQAKLVAFDAVPFDNFGSSVAVSGDTAVVGVYYDDHAGGSNAGSAYVFVRTGGVWTQPDKLVASDAAAGDLFGYSVALSGDRAVVGAIYDDHAGGADAGSAYVFDLNTDPPPGDNNADCQVNLEDYAGFPACMFGPDAPFGAGCEAYDFDGDGDVDQGDYTLLQNAFAGT